jgi:hypothetical protein
MAVRRKPPHNVQTLQRWVAEQSKIEGIAASRLQRWISYMVIAAALDRIRDEYDEPLFVAKGGLAMELRLQLQARASQDFDATFRASVSTMLESLDEALREPYGDFTLSRTEPDYTNDDGFTRLRVRLVYRGRSWQSVVLELIPADGTWAAELERLPAIDIATFGLPGPERIACISIRYQVAQKLHACTETFDDERVNDRSRDLIDLLLLRSLITDMPAVREACVDTFALRGKQDWPPTLSSPDHWPAQYAAESAEIGFSIADVEEAAQQVRALIAEIDAAL